MICLHAFSRAWCPLHVFASSSDWFSGLSAAVVIGQSNNFGFVFATLNWTPTSHSQISSEQGRETQPSLENDFIHSTESNALWAHENIKSNKNAQELTLNFVVITRRGNKIVLLNFEEASMQPFIFPPLEHPNDDIVNVGKIAFKSFMDKTTVLHVRLNVKLAKQHFCTCVKGFN